MPPNSVFESGAVMYVKVTGLEDAQRYLRTVADGIDPSKNMHNLMASAAIHVHRYLMSLAVERPPFGDRGVLPVITGRLKNSIYWEVRHRPNELTGIVASNVDYGPSVEQRRGFMDKAAADEDKPVNDLFAAYINRLIP